MIKSQSELTSDVPKDMLTMGDKLVGIYRQLEEMPNQAGLLFKTYMHYQMESTINDMVPADGLEFTLEPGYKLTILEGCREGHTLNGLIHCVRHGSILGWNGLEVYPIAVGYVTPAADIPEHQVIVLIVSHEVESYGSCD